MERLKNLIQVLIDNDPNAEAADGVTVLEVWRKEAKKALNFKPQPQKDYYEQLFIKR